VAENQPTIKNRMNQELSNFAARLRGLISNRQSPIGNRQFSELALELFALQLKHNPVYRKICAGRKLMPGAVEHWTEIPVVPTAVFKELELSSIPPAERTAVFHSSGTTEQKPSRHFHCPESLELYEASLVPWFFSNVLPDLRLAIDDLLAGGKSALRSRHSAIFLTPPPTHTPHSSLVHMFEAIRQKLGAPETMFVGRLADDGAWMLDFGAISDLLYPGCQIPDARPCLLLGTAFSFVHLLDYLMENNLRFQLPPGSRVMETGGYKNRSRTMPKSELHPLITERLGVPPSHIICEYGMSELSSQAYDGTIQANDLPHPGPLPKERENYRQLAGESGSSGNSKKLTSLLPLPEGEGQGEGKSVAKARLFRFPPWVRVQIVSPETGREVAEGETGLIRIFDLANVFSEMSIQTEDLGIRRGEQFELIGRAAWAEARGCSLMTV